MQSGSLDRRIEFQTSTATANEIGEWVPTWTTLTTVWASILYTDSKETFEGAELVAPNEVTFTTRYLSILTEKMRITYNGNTYDIKHIAEIGRRKGLKIIAVKKDNG